MLYVDDENYRKYERAVDALRGLAARAYGVVPIEDWPTLWRVFWFALAYRFGKPAIIIVGIEVVALVAYFVSLVFV